MKTLEAQPHCTLDEFSHRGVVTSIVPDYIHVSISVQSACSSCHAKGVCNLSDLREQVLEIPQNPGSQFAVGDRVVVRMQRSLGYKALLLGYLIPCCILVTMLIILLSLSLNEGLSGLIALSVLIPYYLTLGAFRNRLKKYFTFRID